MKLYHAAECWVGERDGLSECFLWFVQLEMTWVVEKQSPVAACLNHKRAPVVLPAAEVCHVTVPFGLKMYQAMSHQRGTCFRLFRFLVKATLTLHDMFSFHKDTAQNMRCVQHVARIQHLQARRVL